MRETKTRGWITKHSSNPARRALRSNVFVLNFVVLGIALAMTASVARAADDEDENKSFSDKLIDGIKSTVRGGANIDDGRIQYRERSPLVVPPKIDLPPPDTSSTQAKAPNWPKDPDEGRRRATAKNSKPGVFDSFTRQFLPTKPGAVASAAPEELPAPPRPDNANAIDNPVYDRSGDLFTTQLGLSNLNFFGSKKAETAPFNGEPTRDSLTQPPPGYQTPSPNFAYGTNIKTEVPRPLDTNSAGERVR
jgi:hypothetical protein